MNNCSKCGKQLRDDDLFCPYCGQKTGFNDKQDFNTITRTEPQNRASLSVNSFNSPSVGSTDVFELLSARASQKKSGAATAAAAAPVRNNSKPAPSSGKVTAGDDEKVIEYSKNNFYINNDSKLDVRKSVLFCRYHDAEYVSKPGVNYESSLIMFLAACCKKYAAEHRDFPNRSDMMSMYNAITNHDTHTFTEHACSMAEPLYKWVTKNEEDVEAWTIFAGMESLAENDDGHFSLLAVLMDTLHGKHLDKTYKNLWMMSALYSKFEVWLKDYAGVYLTGYSPFHNKSVDW
ncbi:MAG: zinc-ribbon domain-containing protein [Saccharofermentans sp.]|nr:zinc-ribbon domain-containing protein [Saccharofermentans sp.]